MAILQTKNQIQPKWPLRIDETVGPYTSVNNAAASLKQDFLFLLQTIPGEWPMNPDLGIGLANYLFESPESLEFLDIKTKIQKQLAKYLPNITLINADFNSTSDQLDESVTTLTITYAITDLGLSDEIVFGLDFITKEVFLQDVMGAIDAFNRPMVPRGLNLGQFV